MMSKAKAQLIALGVVLVVLIALPFWLNAYSVQIAITTITYSMLGLAFAFTLRVGLPRFDIPVWWGVGGYTTALLMKAGMSFWLTALIGAMIAVGLGALFFSIALPRGMMPFLMIGIVLTMAFYQLYGAVPLFGGWAGIVGVPEPTIGSFSFLSKQSLYYLGLFFIGLNLLVYYALYNSKIGRAWNAIGSSLKLAHSVGIDVVKYRMANVLIGNFFIALAGSYFVGYYRAALPTVFTFHAAIYVMVFLIIGGLTHSLIGPIVGAAVATFIPEYFRVTQEYQSIATSAFVILILMFLPLGILGLVDERVKPLFTRRNWRALFSKWRKGGMEGT
jgi:branched-chain amino acid transport system permease protein